MSDLEVIQRAVKQASARRRSQQAWKGLWRGFLVGSSLWLLVFAIYKVFPISLLIVTGAAVLVPVLALAGFIHGWLRRASPEEAARWLDSRQQLQERMSTALELAAKPSDEGWKQLLIADAAVHARAVDLRRLLPWRLPNTSRWALLVLAVGAGLGFVPEYRSSKFLQQEKDKQVIQEVGTRLAELTRRNLQTRPPALEPVREKLQNVEELGQTLANTPVTRSEALKDLASAADKLKTEMKELGKTPGVKSLERAARDSNRAGTAASGELQKKMEDLQKQLGDKPASPEAIEKMKEQLEQARKTATGMPDKNSAEGQAARQQMADLLANMARQAQQMGMAVPELDQAIAALHADQTDLFLKEMQAAVTDLEKLKEMAKTLQSLQQAASKIGKDLAEQLQNGQAEMAQQTLQKMIEQLKAANLAPEQLQKVLQEVSKAVKPASEYGKVAEFLKEACKSMQTGDKPGSAQSLANAAEELRKLMEQMNDAQSLMASLEALQRAQMCIGNGKSWGQCQGAPGFKPGGRPGRGVGTWADETGWVQIPENSGLWDNSGIEQPDMDPRGLTDRGEGEVPDAMSPTKVRGQFAPGSPMPSITLKGVSIKGQSTVQFKEAAAAAQTEAESALNHDQVPRAYRGAVRDYFDDFKK